MARIERSNDKYQRAAAKCEIEASCTHAWSDWKEIGRTGDWFHPIIAERKCRKCGETDQDEF